MEHLAYGCDLSHHNENVDFGTLYASLKAKSEVGRTFVYLKATEGTSNTDPTFADRRSRALAYPFERVGLYDFLHPDQDAGLQADHYASTLELLVPREFVIVDAEKTRGWSDLDQETRAMKILHFIMAVKAKLGLHDAQCWVYCSLGWLRGELGPYAKALVNWNLIAARYGVPELGPITPWGDQVGLIWQNSERGTLAGAGAAGTVDTDVLLREWPEGA